MVGDTLFYYAYILPSLEVPPFKDIWG